MTKKMRKLEVILEALLDSQDNGDMIYPGDQEEARIILDKEINKLQRKIRKEIEKH